MQNILLIVLGKIISKLFRITNLGNGSTWPGHIALGVNKKFISGLLSKSNLKIILVAGTNGKTTTSGLIKTALEKNGRQVIQNESGANLLNGIASTLILRSDWKGELKQDFAIFEVDENNLPLIIHEIKPEYLVLLNLFRDQLDRYGEINTIVGKWKSAIQELNKDVKIVLNADDPQIAFLGNDLKELTIFFGLESVKNNKTVAPQHAADSIYCPKCGEKLSYKSISFSHLGDWYCKKCGLQRPKLDIRNFPMNPLSGLYNKYNVLAAVSVLQQSGLTEQEITAGLKAFSPAFGRQEIIDYHGKKVQIFLSKNPTSFNQSYSIIKELGGKNILLVLNDRIPDGKDVSWIWDVDLPGIDQFKNILVAGDRAYEMALRIKYEDQRLKMKDQKQNLKLKTYETLRDAVEEGLRIIDNNETLFVLPTYSAMLEVRKILTGKKIL